MDALEGLNNMLDSMGNQQPATPPAGDPAPAPTGDPAPAPKEGEPTKPVEGEPTPPDPEFTPENMFGNHAKQNQAFANMRVENKRQAVILQNLGKLLNIPNYMDENALLDGIQRQMLDLQSKQMNIPLDILQRLETSENGYNQLRQAQLTDQASIGFQRVKNEFKLTNSQLNEFAGKLKEAGLNPYEQPMDLLKEYKSLYFEQIQKKAIEDAVAEALKRNDKAENQSTKPGSATSPQQGTPKGVSTVADLTTMLDGLK